MNSDAAKRTVVFVTDEVPRPGVAGHLAVNFEVVSFLASRGYNVFVLLARPRLPWPVQRTALNPDRVRVEGPGLVSGRGWVAAGIGPSLRILARQAMGLLPSGVREHVRMRARAGTYGMVDAVLGRFTDAEAAAWIADRAASLQAGAVVVDTIFRAPVLQQRKLCGVPSLLLTHDVFHRRHAALTARGLRVHPAELGRDEELALLRLADVVVAIQPEEEQLLRELLPERRVICTPMAARPRPRPPGVEREPGVLAFVGSDSAHNVDGLRWFLDAVWPRLRALLPNARLEVCGTVGRAIATVPEGVTLRGIVADLGSVLHRAAAAVAPLRAGSGLKIKLLDYAAHGLTTAATTCAVEGFEPAPDRPFVIADEADDFARVAAHLASEATAFGLRERQAFSYCDHYAPERVFASLGAVIDEWLASSRSQLHGTEGDHREVGVVGASGPRRF